MQPARELSPLQIIRTGLIVLASGHPSIPPDKLTHLPDDALDWNKLLNESFVKQWRESGQELRVSEDPITIQIRDNRLNASSGTRTLAALIQNAKSSAFHYHELACAFICIGNLIEDQLFRTNRPITQAIQLQVNSFWNASANRAMAELTESGEVESNLEEYDPTPPELEDY